MTKQLVDLVIVGAGPVGLMCAYLAKLCGMKVAIVDKSIGPLEVGRADALNARTLQLLEIVSLFSELYSLGKPCSTSSVWKNGKFISRQSTWWDNLEGCLHKHFLMLGQSHLEKIIDQKLKDLNSAVIRSTSVTDIKLNDSCCLTTLSSGKQLQSKYVIGADGSRSFVRDHFDIAFDIEKPQMIWAVIDGEIKTDFPKVPEIIVFQAETSDVAWIPREGKIDRFYVRMDVKHFSQAEVIAKINHAIRPHVLTFKEVEWFSQFSVKESVAEKFTHYERIFLVGDACHIHSVNGGQGLNTGLADAFNLIWKLNMVLNFGVSASLLQSYEEERKPIALSVIETSGELVRSTKYSHHDTHAEDYVEIVKKRAGNITGMGVCYVGKKAKCFQKLSTKSTFETLNSLCGSRLFDMTVFINDDSVSLYSILDYTKFTLLIFSENELSIQVPNYVQIVYILTQPSLNKYWTDNREYTGQVVFVRPDSYIQFVVSMEQVGQVEELISQISSESISENNDEES